jgi:hypothetical protein
MSIILRNQLTDTRQYKVTDVALTGVSYDAARNETTLTIPSTDTRHDATNIGDYLIPMRGGNPITQSAAFYSFDILHPEKSLQVINKITGTSERKLVLQGDQRNRFPGAGGKDSPDAFNKPISVSKIIRNRKYRIVDPGETTWRAFGNLYNSNSQLDVATQGRKLASAGTTFVATNSGNSEGQLDADSPIFAVGNYRNGIGGTDLNYEILSSGFTAGRQTTDIAGVYTKVTPYLYQRDDSSIVIQKLGATDNTDEGRWTIWNQDSGQIYFEDKLPSSTATYRFDSPTRNPADTNYSTEILLRPSIGSGTNNGNSPKIEWADRTISVPSDLQYLDNNPDKAGTVVEVAHVSSMIGINRPLSNTDIDSNFVSIENKKLASDGSQPVEGNLIINGSVKTTSIDVSNQILMTGVTPFSTNTGLALGTKDLEVNNIRLSGTINDDALFKQYGIVGFPHSFIADYNTKYSALEPVTILYFSNVDTVTGGEVIQTLGNGKRGRVRRVNSEYNYVQVSELNATNKFIVGDTISGKPDLGSIIKVLNPEDYLKVGQNLRIFGMNQNDTPLATYVPDGTLTNVKIPSTPFAPSVTGRFTSIGSRTFSYKLAQFDIRTGKISGLSSDSVVANAPSLIDFDKNNYVQLTQISRTSNKHLVLVYRKSNDEATHHLIAILGNEDFGATGTNNLTYNDYGAFNKPTWSVLNNDGYHYTADSGLVYVPLNQQQRESTGEQASSKINIPFVGDDAKYSRGFLDTRVASGMLNPNKSLTDSPSFFRITETQRCVGPANGLSFTKNRRLDSPNIQSYWDTFAGITEEWNSPYSAIVNGQVGSQGTSYGKVNEVEFFIDNSRMVDGPDSGIVGGLQKLILDRGSDGERTVSLPGGVYYSKLLTLPNNFKLEGASDRNTVIKSLPWLDDSSNTKTIHGGDISKQYGNYSAGSQTIDGVSYTLVPKVAQDYYPETTTGEIGTSTTFSTGNSRFSDISKSESKLGSAYGIFEGVFGGQKAYARSVVEFDGKSNVEIADIKLDGNLVNQSVVRMDHSGKSNYTLSGQLSKNVSIKNVSVTNSVLGGFYGEEIKEGIVEGSIVKDGGLTLNVNPFATGLYLPGSSKIRLTSNTIENFSNANDLSSNQNSTLVGNIIRDTGSGVLAYATSNLVYEGNLILGPADEYIPVVDTLNSEYDQLNVNLITESGSAGSSFTSDTIQFLRDNSPLDLRPNDTNKEDLNQIGIAITSSIRTMVGLGTQTYFLPDTIGTKKFNYTHGNPYNPFSTNTYIIQPNTELEDGTITLKNGNLSFKITSDSINGTGEGTTNETSGLKTAGNFGSLSSDYNSLPNRPAGEQLIGLVYDINGTEYLYMDSDEGSEKILWSKITVDTTLDAQSIAFEIDSNYAGLFSIGDRIIFTSGLNPQSIGRANEFSIEKTEAFTDAGGHPIFRGLPVKQKTILPQGRAEIVVGISNAEGFTSSDRANLSSKTAVVADSGATPAEQLQCRLGIQNTFSITRGRIVI